MQTINFTVETEVGKDENNTAILKSGSACYAHLDTVEELIDALTADNEQALKILADVNRQRKTDSGNKVRSSLKSRDSEAATKKAFVGSFEAMLTTKNLKISDLIGKTSEEIAALLA